MDVKVLKVVLDGIGQDCYGCGVYIWFASAILSVMEKCIDA